jgi:hypothetical protein
LLDGESAARRRDHGLGLRHPDLAVTLNNLGALLAAQSRGD